MYDVSRIVPGIVIFLLLVTSPFWYGVFSGQTTAAPQLELGTDEEQCVESAEYMRASHLELLTTWRDEVVRGGERTYRASDGRIYDKSLTGTCLKCHSKKAEFCDRCHDYAGVKPDCWTCHVVPQGGS